ncbi:hypothetical protein GOBAR_AA01975 [Gossypium barbadense]|uniref:Uncharacterized protein n=1 Tax=Gossypium barbadense TaxID=3634 RepID=A0A2P5YSK5_GOSBA|nr:hypothetical protein GOBAR_AA01975 [Gossypium barbadense]
MVRSTVMEDQSDPSDSLIVQDIVDGTGNWLCNALVACFSGEVLSCRGVFCLVEDRWEDADELWKLVWALPGSQHVTHFLWDCPALAKLWCHFVPTTKQRLFSDAARVDCLLVNLKRDHMLAHLETKEWADLHDEIFVYWCAGSEKC